MGVYTDLQEIVDAPTVRERSYRRNHCGRRSRWRFHRGLLIGFYPIESSITAGLCMAKSRRPGDLEALSACNRMNSFHMHKFPLVWAAVLLVIASIVPA